MSDVYDWSALAQILKNSGISSGDISRVFSPELGELTGTFYQNPEVSAQEEELSWLQNAPNMRRALNLPDDDIRKIIAAAIYRGENPWDVRRQVEAYTAQQAELNPGVYNQEGETKDLLSFVDTVDSEWRKKTVANMKAGAEGSVLAKAGLPPKELEYSAEQLLPDLFDKLNSQAAGLRAEAAKFSVGDKTKKAALKYLEQQKTQAAAAKEERVPHPSLVPTEGFRAALSRNLANTPMGRGEAGVSGLIPLLKTLEQIPAGLMALQKSVVDPLYQEAAKNAKYIAQETIGTVPDLSVGDDPLGRFLYGKSRNEISKKADDGSYDRAEGARFGRIAQDVVTRAEDPKRKAAAAEAKGREQWMKDFTQILSTLVQERARQTGYTPYNEAVAARVNFLAAGGK